MTIPDQKNTFQIINKTPIYHEIGAPIQHWQLRDMAKSHKNGILYCDNTNVNIYNLKSKEKKVEIPNVSFPPTCIDHLDGISVLGGSKGQILIKKESLFKGQTGLTINNSVKIFKSNGSYKLLVTNNDTTIRLFDLETLTLLQTINHSCAVNNTEISPDGKMMICVSDTPVVYGYYYDNGYFHRYSTFRTFNDAGFKASFNSLSSLFAVSTQDCYSCIFDIRKKDKIFAFKSKQFRTVRGAVRVVEFSKKKNLDLLLFSEHSSCFNIVDCRNFEMRQSIATSKQDVEKSISGALFSNSGDSIVIVFEDSAYEYKIFTESRRMFSEADLS